MHDYRMLFFLADSVGFATGVNAGAGAPASGGFWPGSSELCKGLNARFNVS